MERNPSPRAMDRPLMRLLLCCATALATVAGAQQANIQLPVDELERLFTAEPMVIESARISRPVASGDITLRAEVSFGGAAPLRVKLRRAEPGADEFNNVPRYDIAAYALQKLFLDPEEYVVPPTVLRMMDLADLAPHSPEARPTFAPSDQVLVVIQYWLEDVRTVADVYDPARFASDAAYARHIGQLNVLTYLVGHRDSNLGNFLIGNAGTGARVFSIDHGVAFGSAASDRGELWRFLRVNRLPPDTVARLRQITPSQLTAQLSVLAQWELRDGRYQAVAPGEVFTASRGVRRRGNVIQMGLTRAEIAEVSRQLRYLLREVDRGRITLAAVPSG